MASGIRMGRKGLAATLVAIVAGMALGCGSTAMAPVASFNPAVSSLGYTNAGLKLFVLPEAGVAPVINAIQSAKVSVKMKIYMLTEPQVIDALIAANKKLKRLKDGSPAVQVLMEQWYYDMADPAVIKKTMNPRNAESAAKLKAGGVNVQWAKNRENPGQAEWFNLTHEKSILIDAGTPAASALIMTANMSNSAFTKNREYLIQDRNPEEVAYIDELFTADWTGTPFRKLAPNLVVSPSMGKMANNARAQIIRLLESATKSIVIQMEVISDPDIIAALGYIQKRGVEVRVNVDHNDPRTPTEPEPDDITVQNLSQGGVTNVLFSKDLNMHTKAIVVDGKRAYIGAINLTRGSLDKNRELGILTNNPSIITTVLRYADIDWKNSVKAPGKPVPPPTFGKSPINADKPDWIAFER